MSKRITILGSTGSIGRQSLEVISACGMEAVALTANSSVKLLEEQARRYRPELAVLMDERAAGDLRVKLADTNVRVLGGMEGILEAASLSSADTVITAVVGIVGIWFACNNGFANDMSFKTFIPDLGDTNSLTYLSIILFNFMGFEVVATFASTMKNPSRDIPKAVIAGGVAIAAIYIICGIGIGAAVPTEQLSLDSGIVDAVAAMVGRTHPLTMVVGVAFLVTLFANMICWSFGVNNVASYAARHGNMPRPFALVSKKTGMPNGSALINGCFASLVLLLQIPLGEGSDVFWVFFSMNVVFLLMSYIPMFPAFWRLRKHDNRSRVFRAPFEGKVLAVALAIPVVELVLSIVATIVPLNSSPAEMAKLPILAGVVIGLLLGEVSRLISRRGRSVDNPGVGARGSGYFAPKQ